MERGHIEMLHRRWTSVVSPGEEIAISGGEEGGRETQTIHLICICANTNLNLTHHAAPTLHAEFL